MQVIKNQKNKQKKQQQVKACLKCLEAIVIYPENNMSKSNKEFDLLHSGHPMTILDRENYLLLVEEKFLENFIKEGLNPTDTPKMLRICRNQLRDIRIKLNRYKNIF